ncbi:hypothetical protein AB0G64_09285 [Streptomyces longwoodensis]|uniref:hypothetical protein n=1 Tax=Streptomyces longwoodensis TaxID=68231 RepID=UPI0033C6973F
MSANQRPAVRRDDPRLQIMTEAIERLIPGGTPAFLSVTVAEALPGTAGHDGEPHKHTWTGTPAALAERQFTALYGRPRATAPAGPVSPLAQAEDAKRRRDLAGEAGALMAAGTALESAPWYPCRPGDVVHVHYPPAGDFSPFSETYLVDDAGDGLMSLRLLAHTCPKDESDGTVGRCLVEGADCPVWDLWFEAGPHLLTIVREGRVIHDGAAGSTGSATAVGMLMTVRDLTSAAREAETYLERGEPELALARLRSHRPLPACGTPGPLPGHADCARPRGHRGACSPDADYVEPPHECPALPEQLHAVVTVGAKVTDIHIAGLYEDREAAVDHASGFSPWHAGEDFTERFVKPAPGCPGEVLIELPKENQFAAHGVQLALVVPVQVLSDPREDDALADEMHAAADADDYREVDE